MSDGKTQSDWSWRGGRAEGEKKKKEIAKLRGRAFSGFILIAQGHFSFFTPSPGLAIRASLQNV